jgi:hypothetical protein
MIAILGQQPYRKTYRVMNDQVVMTFRTLSPEEHDMCHRQVYLDFQKQETTGTLEGYWEGLTRYRLYLQVERVQLGEHNIHELPCNVKDWDVSSVDLAGDTPLVLIQRFILDNVLTTDLLHRITGKHCGMFNETVQHLEALVQDPDFYSETASQTS